MASLVIGIDGGASNTVALLAEAASGRVLGRGSGGPSNIQAVGESAALRELNHAVGAAFKAAGLPRGSVAAAALGLAGIDLDGTDVIRGWASLVDLAPKLSVANDATLLFAAGTPEGWGLAVIAGTGSIAFTLDQKGKEARAGGWGYLMGDEGSAFRLGLLGLRAACRAADNIGPTDETARRVPDETGNERPARLHPGRLPREVGQGRHRRPRARRARTRIHRRHRRGQSSRTKRWNWPAQPPVRSPAADCQSMACPSR